MDRSHWSREQDDPWKQDRFLEIESELRSMRGLVCDLLKKNEDLRQALLEAEATLSHDERSTDDTELVPMPSQHRK